MPTLNHSATTTKLPNFGLKVHNFTDLQHNVGEERFLILKEWVQPYFQIFFLILGDHKLNVH